MTIAANSNNFTRHSEPMVSIVPNEKDIIWGGCSTYRAHLGNQELKRVMAGVSVEYAAGSRNVKSSIITAVINFFKSRSNTDGFIRIDERTGECTVPDDHYIREQISQGFRDLLHAKYKSSKISKKQNRYFQRSCTNAIYNSAIFESEYDGGGDDILLHLQSSNSSVFQHRNITSEEKIETRQNLEGSEQQILLDDGLEPSCKCHIESSCNNNMFPSTSIMSYEDTTCNNDEQFQNESSFNPFSMKQSQANFDELSVLPSHPYPEQYFQDPSPFTFDNLSSNQNVHLISQLEENNCQMYERANNEIMNTKHDPKNISSDHTSLCSDYDVQTFLNEIDEDFFRMLSWFRN